MDSPNTKDEDSNLDNLYIALIQCFAVIICGYLTGRTGLITQRETSGLNTFVGKFSLPSIIFISLCKIDLSSVNWIFIFAVFIAKAIIFFLVLIVTMLVTRPTNYARAGLLAIFCTQTNDFAIGVPILEAIYGKTHPEFLSYVYLLAPISLTILNPVAFALMEIGKHNILMERGSVAVDNGRLQLIRSVISNIVCNPIVFMTFLGVLGNFIFDHKPPPILESVLGVFGSAFIGTALMLLGLRMVGRVHTLQGTALLIPALLIIVKLLLTPLVIREVVGLALSIHKSNMTELSDFTTFSFLYGTFPSAPGVFVYATSYGFDIDLVASSMVACTFLSAPLMFVSAKMISAANMDHNEYLRELKAYEFGISSFSIAGICLVLLAFIFNRKFRFPHRITICVLIAHLISCIGSVLKSTNVDAIVPFILTVAGDMCSYLWITALAMTLMFIYSHVEQSLPTTQPIFFLIPWIIPSCMMIILMAMYQSPYPTHLFGVVTAGLTCSVLLFSCFGTVFFLILGERRRRINAQYDTFSEDIDGSTVSICNVDFIGSSKNNSRHSISEQPLMDNTSDEERRPLRLSDSNIQCCEKEMQLLRHFVFLIICVCSFMVTLGMLLWEIFSYIENGVYIELCFIELTLRRGQGITIFVLFFLDNKVIIRPATRWLMKFMYGGNPIELPAVESLPFETRFLCDKFVSLNLQRCKMDIEKTNWCSLLYGKCFSGAALVNWLISNDIVENGEEAGVYASKLLSGRVIRHIYNTEFFYNNPCMLYTFVGVDGN